MKHGGVEPLEMARTFNNGIGMVVIVAPENVGKVLIELRQGSGEVYQIGEVTNVPGVEMRDIQSWVEN